MEPQIIKERNEKSLDIRDEVAKQCVGKKRDDATQELGVSLPTFQHIKNDHGIKKNKNNPSIFEESAPNKRLRVCEDTSSVSSSSTHPSFEENACPKRNVIIKATSGVVAVRFSFYEPWTMKMLREQVGQRFELQTQSFRMKYEDEVGTMTLLPKQDDLEADDDLSLCIDTLTSLGKEPIHISVQPI